MKRREKFSNAIRFLVLCLLFIIVVFLSLTCFVKAESEAIDIFEKQQAVTYTIDLTGIITAIIGLIFTLFTTKLVPLIKVKTTKEQQETLIAIARTVVYAAEQLYGAGHGEDKLDYAMSRLGEMGYKIDSAEVRAVVEAAVKELKLVA